MQRNHGFSQKQYNSWQFVRVMLNMTKDLGFFGVVWAVLIAAFRCELRQKGKENAFRSFHYDNLPAPYGRTGLITKKNRLKCEYIDPFRWLIRQIRSDLI